jgi:hypothetical protein
MQACNILNFLILFSSLHMLLVPARFLLGFNPNFFILLVYFCFNLFILLIFIKKKFFNKINALEFMVIIIPILLLPISIFNGQINHHLIVDILKPLLFVVTIVFFKNVNLKSLLNSKNLVSYMTFFYISCILSASILIFFYIFKGGFYLSATSSLILIPIFYFYFKKNFSRFFLGIIVIINAGKRAVLLSFIISYLILFLSKIKSLKQLIFYFSSFIIIIFSVWILFINGYLDDILMVKKITTAINLVEDKSFIYAFGGRAEEIIYSLSFFFENPLFFLVGAGPGYVYNMNSAFGLELKNVHGVHFSPVGIFTIYGPMFFLLLYYYLFKQLKKSYKVLKSYNGKNPLVKTAALFIIANFIASFTAFSIFTPIYFAIFIGMINNKTFYEDDNIK